MLYLYAIIDQPEAPVPEEPGLENTATLCVSYGDIAAVVSPLAASKVPATEANLWKHEGVIESLMADWAVLPARFGTVLTDEAAIRDVLTTHYAHFVATLERVRGRVELGLRVLWDPPRSMADSQRSAIDDIYRPPFPDGRSSPASGRGYLLARLEREREAQVWRREAEALAAEVHAPLARLAAKSTRQVLLTPRLLLTAAYLIERDRVKAFRRKVEGLSAANPELCFLCTGPWPPYNFVTTAVPEIVTRDLT